MKPEDIKVGSRHRKDYGDIDGLAGSIADVGLLNPVVVDGEGRLVAGGRRLAACRHLGWDDIPVIVAMNLTEAGAALRAERDENTQRKDFLPSEIASIGRALEEVYRPEAEQRVGGRPSQTAVPGNRGFQSPQKARVREQVGEALGVGGATYERIKTVARDAEDGALSETQREAAASALSQMDNGRAVRSAYQEYREEHTVQQSTAGTPNQAPAKRAAVPSADTPRGQQARKAHARRIADAVSRFQGVTDGIPLLEDIAPTALEVMSDDDIASDIAALGETASAINRLKRRFADELNQRKSK